MYGVTAGFGLQDSFSGISMGDCGRYVDWLHGPRAGVHLWMKIRGQNFKSILSQKQYHGWIAEEVKNTERQGKMDWCLDDD